MTGATVAARPVQIVEFKTAIRDVSPEELNRIRSELQNNVRHLERSSERLRRYIAKLQGELKQEPDELDIEIEDDNIEQSDLQLFKDSLHENELVLRNYHERLEALGQEQLHRSPHVSTSVESRVPKVTSEGEGEGVNSDNNPSDNNALNSVYL